MLRQRRPSTSSTAGLERTGPHRNPVPGEELPGAGLGGQPHHAGRAGLPPDPVGGVEVAGSGLEFGDAQDLDAAVVRGRAPAPEAALETERENQQQAAHRAPFHAACHPLRFAPAKVRARVVASGIGRPEAMESSIQDLLIMSGLLFGALVLPAVLGLIAVFRDK